MRCYVVASKLHVHDQHPALTSTILGSILGRGSSRRRLLNVTFKRLALQLVPPWEPIDGAPRGQGRVPRP